LDVEKKKHLLLQKGCNRSGKNLGVGKKKTKIKKRKSQEVHPRKGKILKQNRKGEMDKEAKKRESGRDGHHYLKRFWGGGYSEKSKEIEMPTHMKKKEDFFSGLEQESPQKNGPKAVSQEGSSEGEG